MSSAGTLMTMTKKGSWSEMVDDHIQSDDDEVILGGSPSFKIKNTFIEEIAFEDEQDRFFMVNSNFRRSVTDPCSDATPKAWGSSKALWSDEVAQDDSDTDGVSTGPSLPECVERQETSASGAEESTLSLSPQGSVEHPGLARQAVPGTQMIPQDIDETSWCSAWEYDAGYAAAQSQGNSPMAPQGMMMIPVIMDQAGNVCQYGQQTVTPMPMAGISAMQSREWSNIFTVMMRNLPNKVNQAQLLQHLDDEGFMNAYDFVYLPIDPETNANRGYAFINFTTVGMALIFRMHFEGQRFSNFHSKKVLCIVPAKLQGFEANYSHYSNAHLNYIDPAAWPIFLREPTQSKKAHRSGKNSQSLIDVAARELRGGKQAPQKQQGLRAPATAAPVASAYSAAESSSADDAEESSSVDKSTERVAKFCYSCGGGIEAYFKFCRCCGTSVKLEKK